MYSKYRLIWAVEILVAVALIGAFAYFVSGVWT